MRSELTSSASAAFLASRYVAIDPTAIAINRQDEKNWMATMNVTKDQLRAAPEYKWQSEWRKR
jgi:hypothetical protein